MQLAQPGDPLVTSNGEIIEAAGRKEPNYTLETPIARHIQPKNPRSVRELGTDGQTQTIVNAVLVYKLIGVSPNEVAHLLGTTPAEVDRIQRLPTFQETFEILFGELISASSMSLQARIKSYAGKALTNMIDLADAKPTKIKRKDDDGEEYVEEKYFVPPIVILKANQDILDRSGMSAETLYNNNSGSEGQQLEIEITSASENRSDLKINIKGGR